MGAVGGSENAPCLPAVRSHGAQGAEDVAAAAHQSLHVHAALSLLTTTPPKAPPPAHPLSGSWCGCPERPCWPS